MDNQNNTAYTGDRADAVEKVTGKAKYTADHVIENVRYGVFVTSTIAKGSVKNMVLSKAKASPGVLDIIYYLNCPVIPGYQSKGQGFEWRGLKVFNDNIVHHYGQPLALVVADTWENAVAAARLVKPEYVTKEFETDFNKLRTVESKLKSRGQYSRGEKDAYKNAEVMVEAEYNIPIETHNPIEMHATIARWDGDDKLLIYDKSQGPKGTQRDLANCFGLDVQNVRVITEYVGAAFGNALRSWPHVLAACIAAKKLKQPVKVVLNRQQMFTMVGYRPYAWQKMGMGASKDGKLTGITHHAISNTSNYEDYTEGIVNASQYLYECPNVNTSYKILPLDLNTPTWMRGPGEATGSFAIESALDELSYKLNMDPVELRLINYAEVNPQNKLPWSSKFLKECYEAGKEKIGWKNRPQVPGSLTENGMLVGYGMGGGVFGAYRGNATVRGVIKNDGSLLMESAVSDMGPGTITAMIQIASEAMQLPAEKIRFSIGDTDYPEGPTQGGSATTSTLGSAVFLCCNDLKKKLKGMAIEKSDSFKNLKEEDLDVKNGIVFSIKEESNKVTIQDLLALTGEEQVEVKTSSAPDGSLFGKYAMNSFSAHFVIVQVDPQTWEVKIKNVVATGDGGKIINEKTARSQMIGGAVGGIGMALTEELLVDPSNGSYSNNNLGSYKVPHHTDVPFIDTWFPNKPDPVINPVGAKGVGEIALIGFAAAVANAVFNATGKRVRDLPITPERLKMA